MKLNDLLSIILYKYTYAINNDSLWINAIEVNVWVENTGSQERIYEVNQTLSNVKKPNLPRVIFSINSPLWIALRRDV